MESRDVSYILGTGSALPQRVVTNKELFTAIGLSEEAIERKTGILTRHWVTDGETTATLAMGAAHAALQSAGILPQAIDLIIVSTSSPDRFFPSVACLVQNGIGCRPITAFDINASCSGFLYALCIADQFIRGGTIQNALIIASEVKSRYLNPKQAQTASLFGDGAGAVVLGRNKVADSYTLRFIQIHAGGPSQQLIHLPAGGSRLPLSIEALKNNLHQMQMDGTRLFKLAINKMDEALFGLLKENDLSLEDMDLFIFHQANARILDAVLKRHDIPQTKHHTTIRKFGNTSSASLPIALDDAIKSGKVGRGTRLGLCAFGGGFTWGTALIEVEKEGSGF